MSAFPEPVSLNRRLPSGTVTFAFTDIEGSTQRWERDGASMRDAVRRHDALMRTTIAAHGGHVFKTIGDAFCVAFARPERAIAAMRAVQRALGAEDFSAIEGIRVRAAIHTGIADERDDDYFGPTVNRVARLLAIGHGGQVLVSGVTTDLVHEDLPEQATLRDLGEHRLKDLGRPEHVYQLLAPDLAADFPPLRSLDARSNNLPAALTSFVGRENEIAEITGLLDAHRLVTLVGSGGIGKTRTSLHVAANLLDGFGDGVWFVELAPLTSGDYIASTVSQIFGISLPSDGDPADNLARALKAKEALLVFDNCEHLVEPTARIVAALLRGCPKLKVLASSRQGLGIAGEETYRLPTLAVPAANASTHLTASDAAGCAAIALFADRARAVDQRFVLTDENAPIVADICRRLDGIPLAIELAAARVKILSPRQLRERLDERFRVLTGGSRDVLPRQQTLRATIDWSHDLLDDRERALFRRLGIFVDGFTLEGAAAVGSGDDLDELAVLDVLSSLIDKSLVLAEGSGDEFRYRQLESTRVYAMEKLAAAGEREVWADRHLRYLRDYFARARELWDQSGRMTEMVDALRTELDDARSALDIAAREGNLIGAELLADVDFAWEHVGLDSEGLARIEASLALLPEDCACLRARLLSTVALLAGNAGRKARAFEVATQAVKHARLCGDGATLANALRQFAERAAEQRRFEEAEEALGEAEAIASVPLSLRLRLFSARAHLSGLRGDLAAAAVAHGQLRIQFQSLGDERADITNTTSLAEVEHERGLTQRAVALAREVLPTLRSGTDWHTLVLALMNLAGYLAALDDLSEACETAREAIREFAVREPEHAHAAIAIEHLALGLALGGDLERAAALQGYAEGALQRAGFEREFTEQTTHDRLTALLRERLALQERSRLFTDGDALKPEAAIALALAEP